MTLLAFHTNVAFSLTITQFHILAYSELASLVHKLSYMIVRFLQKYLWGFSLQNGGYPLVMLPITLEKSYEKASFLITFMWIQLSKIKATVMYLEVIKSNYIGI